MGQVFLGRFSSVGRQTRRLLCGRGREILSGDSKQTARVFYLALLHALLPVLRWMDVYPGERQGYQTIAIQSIPDSLTQSSFLHHRGAQRLRYRRQVALVAFSSRMAALCPRREAIAFARKTLSLQRKPLSLFMLCPLVGHCGTVVNSPTL